MKIYIALLTTPNMEDCVQVSDENYMQLARLEARIYKKQLVRMYGPNPVGTEFKIGVRSAGICNYMGFELHYDEENQRHITYVEAMNRGCDWWDEIAKKQLKGGRYLIRAKAEIDSTTTRQTIDDDVFFTNDNGPTGHGEDCYSDANPGF